MEDIPLGEGKEKEFDQWIRDRWTEKDALLEQYVSTGRFPASEWIAEDSAVLQHSQGKNGEDRGFIVTEMKPKAWWEVFGVFKGLTRLFLVVSLLWRGFESLKLWAGAGGVRETAVLERPVAEVPQAL